MITGKWLKGSDKLDDAFAVRMEVFVREQGFSEQAERDEMDARAVHCVLYDDGGAPAATGRLYIDNEGYWHLGRIAVLKALRGKQLGDLVMRMLLDKALGAGAQHLRVGAQTPVAGFYARYGFCPVGELYYEEGVAHQMMEATRESVLKAVFSGCGGH